MKLWYIGRAHREEVQYTKPQHLLL